MKMLHLSRPCLRRLVIFAAAAVLAGLGTGYPSILNGGTVFAASLPEGASSLQETYQDWQVTCSGGEQGAECLMVQEQRDARSDQRVLAVELGISEEGDLSGALLLPFGLALGVGVVPQVDEGAPWDPLAFSTCLPAGCIVPLPLGDDHVAALRRGSALRLTAQVPEGDRIIFTVSLQGFSAAMDRLAALLE